MVEYELQNGLSFLLKHRLALLISTLRVSPVILELGDIILSQFLQAVLYFVVTLVKLNTAIHAEIILSVIVTFLN